MPSPPSGGCPLLWWLTEVPCCAPLQGNLTFPAHFSVTARDLIRKLLQVGGGEWLWAPEVLHPELSRRGQQG